MECEMVGGILSCMACHWDETPDASLRDCGQEALAAAGYINKTGAADADADPSQWTRYCATGRWPLYQLLRLSPKFWEHFLPKLAARLGYSVVSRQERGAVEAVIAVARALDGGDAVSTEEQTRIVNALVAIARQVDPMRRVA